MEPKRCATPRSMLRLWLMCALTLLGCTRVRHLSAETFRNPNRIATSSDPVAIAVGDLNGDGRLDIVWGERVGTSAILHVLLAQANGTYQPGTSFGLPTSVDMEFRLADVTGDGKLDLVTTASAATNGYLVFFVGKGDGTFGSSSSFLLPYAGGNYFDPEISPSLDLNGDGIPDFIVASALNGVAYSLLGDGKGGFQVKGTIQLNGFPTMADVNGDGKPDLLFPYGPSVSLGNGDGTFRGPYLYSVAGTSIGTCAYHDMDGDGHLDAVCGLASTITGDINGSTTLYVQHGNADGTFNLSTIASQTFGDHTDEYSGDGTFGFPLAVADVNGDGLPDVIAYANDGISILLQTKALSFASPVHYATGYISSTFTGYASVLVDLNGDGSLDIVNAGPNGIYISYGSKNGTLGAAPAYEVSEVIGYATVADFNGDGIPDIVASGYRNLEISLGVGDGTFKSYTALPNNGIDFSAGDIATEAHILHGDFNGDGKPDILAIGSSSTYQYDFYILFNTGNGVFQPPVKVPNTSSIFPMYEALFDSAVYDVNHDGRSDILRGSTLSGNSTLPLTLEFLLSNGDGTFNTVSTTLPTDLNQGYYYNSLPVLADFNGDGKLDAVYGSVTHAYVVLGHGDGTFNTSGTMVAIPNPTMAASVSTIATATGDFDGDGKQDFVILVDVTPAGSDTTAAAWVYYGNGDGTFSNAVSAGTFDRAYTNIAVSDLNQDGLADIILKTSGSLGNGYAVGVVNAQPGRSFGPEVNYVAGTGLSSLSTADLNGDGFPDLTVANGDFNIRASSVTVLLNLGNAPTVTGTLTANPEPSVAGAPFTMTAALSPPTGGTVLAGSVSFSVDGNALGSVALSSNGAAIAGPTTLSVGQHLMTATWPGDSTFAPVTLAGTHVVTAIPTSVTLTCSPNPISAFGAATFAAGAYSGGVSVQGGFTFTDNGAPLYQFAGPGSVAAYTDTALAVGTHQIVVTFVPTGNYAGSSASCTEVVNALPTSSVLTVNPTSVTYGGQLTLTANVAPVTPIAGHVPTGTVTFFETFPPTTVSQGLGSAALNASGVAVLTTSAPPVRSGQLGCTYSGDSAFAVSQCNVVPMTVAAAASTLTLTSSLNPAPVLAPVTFTVHLALSGGGLPAVGSAVSLSLNSQAIVLTTDANGNATYTTSSLPVGSDPVTASFGGSASLLASSAALIEVIQLLPTTTMLTAAPNPAYQGQTVTLTATVSGSPMPTGSMTFLDNGMALGTGTLSAAGVAALTTSTLAVGTHPLTASYAAGSVFAASTSPVVPEVVLASGFAIALVPTSVTIPAGQTKSVAIQLTSLGMFAGPLKLTYGQLPTYATASISPTTVTLTAGGAVASALTLNTLQHAENVPVGRPFGRGRLAGVMSALVLLGVSLVGRRKWTGRVVLALALVGVMRGLTGCTNAWYRDEVVAAGSYAVPVTATDVNGNSQTASLTVVVTP